MSIEGHNLTSTGIHGNAEDGTGNAGIVNVRVNDTLYIENGGAIASSTFAQGKAGIVNVGKIYNLGWERNTDWHCE